ncbi:MAG: hypothetical protein JFR41_10880 [Muribaculaceae bacterium]|nr:hypothetical protein [Muribaculaceae bacterium]
MTDDEFTRWICAHGSIPTSFKPECPTNLDEAWSVYTEMQHKSLGTLQALTLHCSATAATLLGLTALFQPSLPTGRIFHMLMLAGISCLFLSCLCGILYNVGAFAMHRKSMRIFFERAITGREAIHPAERVRAPLWLTPTAIACPVLMLLGILSFAMPVFAMMS